MVGPPGTGKTAIALAIAQELGNKVLYAIFKSIKLCLEFWGKWLSYLAVVHALWSWGRVFKSFLGAGLFSLLPLSFSLESLRNCNTTQFSLKKMLSCAAWGKSLFKLWLPLKDHGLESLCSNASLLLRNIVPPVLVFSSLLIISQFVFLKLILFMDRVSYRGLGSTYHMSSRVYCEPPVACLPNQQNNYSTFLLCHLCHIDVPMSYFEPIGPLLPHGGLRSLQRRDQEDRGPHGKFPASDCSQNQRDQRGSIEFLVKKIK